MGGAIIPDGAVVWIKDPAKDSQVGFIKATVQKFTEGRGYTVKTLDGQEKTVRPVDAAQANPDNMSAPDNCYLIHISESTILETMRMRFAKKAITRARRTSSSRSTRSRRSTSTGRRRCSRT